MEQDGVQLDDNHLKLDPIAAPKEQTTLLITSRGFVSHVDSKQNPDATISPATSRGLTIAKQEIG